MVDLPIIEVFSHQKNPSASGYKNSMRQKEKDKLSSIMQAELATRNRLIHCANLTWESELGFRATPQDIAEFLNGNSKELKLLRDNLRLVIDKWIDSGKVDGVDSPWARAAPLGSIA